MKTIIFKTDDVQAILEGRKTQTRRVIKPRYRDDEGGFQVITNKATGERWVEKVNEDEGSIFADGSIRTVNPAYLVGDVLWVREAWRPAMDGYTGIDHGGYWYRASSATPGFCDEYNPWRPSIHMPREAARIFLRVTDVRVERVQEISVADAIAEGMRHGTCDIQSCIPCIYGYGCPGRYADNEFAEQWESIYRKRGYGWNENPWCWVYEFERISKEEATHGH